MDIVLYLRLLAHAAGIGLITAIIIVLAFAWYYGWSIRISHIPLAITSMFLFDFWFLLLLISLRDIGVIPREVLTPLLGSLEAGALILGWSWFVFMLKSNFRFSMRPSVEPTPSI